MKNPRRAGKFRILVYIHSYEIYKHGRFVAMLDRPHFTLHHAKAIVKRLEEKRTK